MEERIFCIKVLENGSSLCDKYNFQWRSMVTDGKRAVFVDAMSIKRIGSKLTAWIYIESFIISNPDHAMVAHISTDCSTKDAFFISSSSWTYASQLNVAKGYDHPPVTPEGSLLGTSIRNLCKDVYGRSGVDQKSFIKEHRINELKLHSDGTPIGPFDSTDYE